MSFETVGLGKLLRAMYANRAERTSLLRRDIREGMRRNSATFVRSKGGDFYGPLWADAKRHVAGTIDLRLQTEHRVERNSRRERLYKMGRDGFLLWWEDKRRLRNVPFRLIDESIKARYNIAGAGTVKVENILAITVGDDGHRIIYPYFCEEPVLSNEAARVGLWVMSRCVKRYSLKDMRILDVIRGRSYSEIDTPQKGDEEVILQRKYSEVLFEWRALKAEYE